jgi:secondary thiamine-phosphate synthase enzyme
MSVIQKEILLRPKGRGFHIITDEILNQLPEINQIQKGILNLFLKHTSASLAINENASPNVRTDLETYFNKSIPENASYYTHNLEGSDDMPAHIKNVTIGTSLTIPVTDGKLNLGTWQGIYLCEHRNHHGGRTIVITVYGD